MAVPTCRDCGARIKWIESEKGNPIPCDPQMIRYIADPEGPERIVHPGGKVIRARIAINARNADGVGYRAHFATCPEAVEKRKKKNNVEQLSLF